MSEVPEDVALAMRHADDPDMAGDNCMWHNAVDLANYIRELWIERERLTAENAQLREALGEIASSKYQNYANVGSCPYGIGVADGHRYCAAIARKALNFGG